MTAQKCLRLGALCQSGEVVLSDGAGLNVVVMPPIEQKAAAQAARAESAQVALSGSGQPVALGSPMLAHPSALGLVTPAGRYSVIHYVPNTIDGLRNRGLRALLAQTFCSCRNCHLRCRETDNSLPCSTIRFFTTARTVSGLSGGCRLLSTFGELVFVNEQCLVSIPAWP